MSQSTSLRRTMITGVATLGLLGGSTLFAGGAGAELPPAATFTFTGAAQSYQVAEGVCAVEIVAAGAQGGTWFDSRDEVSSAIPGGTGGVATSTVEVTPGETLQVNVGGAGGDANESSGGAGGFNGGGAGGWFDYEGWSAGSGGGGGASDVRQGGTELSDRVIVGGGGGGTGTWVDDKTATDGVGVPGVGGNPATDGGGDAFDPDTDGVAATGGGAGTATAGGAAGAGIDWVDSPDAPSGTAGSLGVGGAGGYITEYDELVAGGGGGGGLYGGGGGATGHDNGGSGGGGSSLGDATDPGTQTGDGSVTITPVTECDAPAETTTTSVPSTTTTPAAQKPATTAPPAAAVAARPTYTG